jgi:transcription elongation factor GreA
MIETARALGDLSENADYHAAKERSGMVEAKIRDVEAKLSQAQIVTQKSIPGTDKVVFGVSVKLSCLDNDEEKVYAIVGADESDTPNGLISVESPIAKALIGKGEGDVATLQTLNGKREYEILKIFLNEELFEETVPPEEGDEKGSAA